MFVDKSWKIYNFYSQYYDEIICAMPSSMNSNDEWVCVWCIGGTIKMIYTIKISIKCTILMRFLPFKHIIKRYLIFNLAMCRCGIPPFRFWIVTSTPDAHLSSVYLCVCVCVFDATIFLVSQPISCFASGNFPLRLKFIWFKVYSTVRLMGRCTHLSSSFSLPLYLSHFPCNFSLSRAIIKIFQV